MFRRALPTLLMTAILLGASVATLGRPDFGLAGQFLGGGFPTTESAIAVVSLICYAVVVIVAIAAVVGALRAAGEAQRSMRRSTRAAMFLLSGVIVLGVGVANRSTNHFAICCGSGAQQVQEAAQLAAR